MTASSQPLVSQAGLEVLREGGNAADAAVAMAAAINVTEPCSTGIGGDCFALFYDASTRTVAALNGSGRAPAGLTIDLARSQGLERQGQFSNPHHAHTVTVPGACAGWCDLAARHGTMPLSRLLAPAIALAEQGFPVAPMTAEHWAVGAEGQLSTARGGRALTINGRGPRPGEIFRNQGLARTLRAVAEGGAAAFYRGPIARDLARAVREEGGVLTEADLAAHQSTWDQPISVPYRGVRVWECPPNGQGLVALMALSVLSGFDIGSLPTDSVDRWHLLIEAVRLGFADGIRYIADPRMTGVPVSQLLSREHGEERRSHLDLARARTGPLPGLAGGVEPRPMGGVEPRPTGGVEPRPPGSGTDTVYFCCADGAGNACSFINSNYMGFGTGIVPSTANGDSWGFSLQNRGMNFSLDPDHPNALAPGKRPYHTIIPGMMTREDGSLLGPFGVMGGFMQPQGHVQVAVALLDDRVDPQSALDRVRFFVDPTAAHSVVSVEEGLPQALVGGLTRRGHTVSAGVSGHARAAFGRGQVILRDRDGVLWAGSDPRADGCAMGF
ncbi:MAG TPA: gamma-glutamyltransferase family protein [Spirochaetia bacterium]|nr:gamma-glutamyltransferase family protein [Spirochaetia bacterium]